VTLLLPLLLVTTPALAHKLKVFATAEGKDIRGSVYFAGGGPAAGCHVEVRDFQGRILATLSPDREGRFSYQAQAPMDHMLVAVSDDGHQARWTLAATDLTGSFPGTELPASSAGQVSPADAKPIDAANQPATAPGQEPVQLDPATLAAIETLLARQIRPLREELDAAQDQARLHDILGGVGTIFGIVGLALWWGARRRPKPGGPS
jgi:nickel transport protein